MKIALIIGITGQTGSYLAEVLLEKNYIVHGIIRRSSSFNTHRIQHLFKDPHNKKINIHLHYGDIEDSASLQRIIKITNPDEIYNLAAQSHVRTSFDIPIYTAGSVGMGALKLFEVLRNLKTNKKIRIYQASSSEMFGNSNKKVQNEKTPFAPTSPYAAAKLFSYHSALIYRKSYNMFISNGILFNHESPRRLSTFVTRKITHGVAKILAGEERYIYLGNINAKRDWGYALDYAEAIWKILQYKKPDDFVIATNKTYSVKDFLEETFKLVGLDWKKYVKIDDRYKRPFELDYLKGDYSKAKKLLKWEPKTDFKKLVRKMLEYDLEKYGIQDKIKK